MRATTRLIAVFWLAVGTVIWWMALNQNPMPASWRFFATIQILGGVLLLFRLTVGWLLLITMSAFSMVAGIFALITVPFMPEELIRNAPGLLGMSPRVSLALSVAVGILVARFCWLGLRNDPPSNWGKKGGALPNCNFAKGEECAPKRE